MSQRIYQDAILRISEQEQRTSLESSNIIADSYRMTSFLRELLAQMKQHVLMKGFTNKAEEIEFFRKVKPQILGKLMYYNRVYRVEISCPVAEGKCRQKYYSGELQLLKHEYQDQIVNSDFFRYYRSGRTDLDHEYFELGKINFDSGLDSYVFEIDSQFSTYYDYKVASIVASELMYSHLMSKIKPDFVEVPHDKEFYWSDSKNALIELLYALHAAHSISGGRVGIRKITAVLQVLFRIKLGDIHHAFHRMKVRGGSRTAFLDRLKTSLEEYMDKEAS
ncbi:RteC domain-containing protein [Pedobacter alluvionis]|uniref:RteC protein n=1 Tax=Pedobacter alluvionis TaxID=475253 RepID=A0A497XYQ2_9SPHI|nr:RteC domain-containing protein [Pedobacter alluvionis]RLJ75083.1 RteC protein [Pedobacter alluvionis]TFB30192.1 tetracycline regulation of excision, RteC [Pedobacter alluvionis]